MYNTQINEQTLCEAKQGIHNRNKFSRIYLIDPKQLI